MMDLKQRRRGVHFGRQNWDLRCRAGERCTYNRDTLTWTMLRSNGSKLHTTVETGDDEFKTERVECMVVEKIGTEDVMRRDTRLGIGVDSLVTMACSNVAATDGQACVAITDAHVAEGV